MDWCEVLRAAAAAMFYTIQDARDMDLPQTFSIVAEAHFGLAQANCVFSSADAIELLELGLLDILSSQDMLA